MSDNKYIKITPNPLNIIMSKDEKNSKKNYSIKIENLTSKYLLFQFLINKQGILIAKPSTSYIKPLLNIDVEIILDSKNMNLEKSKEMKVYALITPYNEEIKHKKDVKKLLEKLKNNKNIENQMVPINIKFIAEEIINTDINDNIDINNKINNNNFDIENVNNNITKNEESTKFINYSQTKKDLEIKNKEILKTLENNRKKLESLSEENYKSKRKDLIKNNKYNFDNLILISIILIGLIIGANFAKLFKR